ncbi:aminoglycoside adenylyltransferase domain-containing protein [Lactiplantibacillus daowaiensis]|uniref:Spectinomycin 9-adenylyltransferase n=1 Tax=Lactiplantibacillus daowaiensis TaxID=2559918 RepID=A0ABW1S2M5_9LACO
MTGKTHELLTLIQTTTQAILTTNLVGIYLHGSYVLGSYNENVSDLDYLIVVKRPLTFETKQALMQATITKLWPLSPAKGLEWHVLLLQDTQHFQQPLPFELHFSKQHYAAYCQQPLVYINRMHGTDPDLAAHLTIIHAAGQVLVGPAINSVFSPVPATVYWQSLVYDVADAQAMMLTQPMYTILNLCRVLAYQRQGLILSKKGGGEWGLKHLPKQYHCLFEQALSAYTAKLTQIQTYPTDLAQIFAKAAVASIQIGKGRLS